ncbi:MAG: GNAT family N-acetyltransferase [Dehalococcoidia bacterium]
MDVRTFENNAGAFYDTALPYLTDAEAENVLLIGVSSRLATEPAMDSPQSFFWTVRDGGEVCGAAMWTPPHDLILSHPLSDAAVGILCESLLGMELALPGVLGPDYAASEFAGRWTAGGTARADLWRRERIYRLQQVEPFPVPGGTIVQAEEDHVSGLTGWLDGFFREVGEEGDPSAVLSTAVAAGRLFLWWRRKPVSMAASTRPTPNGVCINLVYTPPEERRRGYATALVGTLSRMLLGQGRSFCALYTDLANPTSNSMYRRVGYVPILDCHHYRFVG